MQKRELVKAIIRQELRKQRALILNACKNELDCYREYMVQRRQELELLPIETLENYLRGTELFRQAA